MDIQHLIGLAINGSMFLIVLSLGLHATERDATSLLRDPPLLVRSLLSMNAIMLVAAVLIILVFNPAPEIKIALVALALSPVPPILPGKQMKSGGSTEYSIGLLVAASLASVIIVPLGLLLLDAMFGLNMHIAIGSILGIVLISIAVPLAVGIMIRAVRPAFADRIAGPLSIFATLLLVVALIPVIIVSWGPMVTLIGNGLVVGLVLFSLIGLAAGHWLGGPDSDNRSVLALATSARHPGIAMAIATLNFPDAKLAGVVVLYHLLVSIIVAVPYVKWRTRQHAIHHRGAL